MRISFAAKQLQYIYGVNSDLYKKGLDRLSVNLIGPAGIGKTAIAKQALGDNVRICKVNPAQFVDAGDVSGIPEKYFYVYTDTTRTNTKLVSEKVAEMYAPKAQIFYEVMNSGKKELIPQQNIKNISTDSFVRNEAGKIVPITVYTEDLFVYEDGKQMCETHYATPFWWPKNTTEKVVLILDDSWRSSGPIQQALMELQYEYKFNGKDLPENVMIIVTNNPADGDYTVQSLDPAQLRRTVNIKVEFNVDDYLEYEAETMNEYLLMFLHANKDALKRTEGTGKDAITYVEMAANVTRFSQWLGEGDPKKSAVAPFFISGGSMFFGDDSKFVQQFDTWLNGKQHMLPSAEEFFTLTEKQLEKQLEPVKNKLGLMGVCVRRVSAHLRDNKQDFDKFIPRIKYFFDGGLFTDDKLLILAQNVISVGGPKYLSDPNFRQIGRFINQTVAVCQ